MAPLTQAVGGSTVPDVGNPSPRTSAESGDAPDRLTGKRRPNITDAERQRRSEWAKAQTALYKQTYPNGAKEA